MRLSGAGPEGLMAVEEMLGDGSPNIQRAVKHPQHHVFPQECNGKSVVHSTRSVARR